MISVQSSGIADYCLTFFPGSTTLCQVCKPGYIILIYSQTSTLCVVAPAAPTSPCTVDVTMYPTESAAVALFQFDYFPASSTGRQALCFSCDFYYTRQIKVNNVVLAASNQCKIPALGGVNSGCIWSAVSSSFYLNSVFSLSIGCQTCQSTSQHASIAAYPMQNVFVRDCNPPAATQVESCSLSQYYNSKLRSCKECKTLFPNCAACNLTQCLMCPSNYYLHKNVYDYDTRSIRSSQCVFDVCPKNTCKNQLTNRCDPIGTGLKDNCALCTVIGANQECEQCDPELVPTANRQSCIAPAGTPAPINYFVKSFAPYKPSDFSADNYNPTANCPPKTRGKKFQKIHLFFVGKDPTCPYYFIQEAITDLLKTQYTYTLEKITATIYLFKGDHYFFQCDGNEDYTDPAYAQAQLYCKDDFLPIMQRSYWIDDMIFITVKPMYCSLQATLLQVGVTDFTQWCALNGVKPKIYVNAANFYFNITGEMAFENIAFTGINGMLNRDSGIDYTKFPATFCSNNVEPNGYDRPFDLITNKVALSPFFPQISCADTRYQGGLDVDMTINNRRCKMNQNQKFSSDVESTISCRGEPNDPDFFTEINGIYTLRRFTLFNLYSFPNHMSSLRIPPALNLTNCEFKFFLDGYDSLINVEYNNLKKLTKTYSWTTTVSGAPVITTQDITQYYFNGAEKGARIRILNSQFKNSRFCKGMIVYRKPIQILQQSVITNFTHLFSLNTNYDKGSYIIIQASTFTQMNVFTNITALAAYNSGMSPNLTLSDPNQLDLATYRGFIHLGIVINIEDFGGNVEVMNSIFNRNIHFFPEAASMPRKKSASMGVEQFRRSSSNPEYKMSACDMDSKTDLNFFTIGFQIKDDIDLFFDKLERMAVIYISRNKRQMYFKENTFWRNTGTFGGAITINSPNFQTQGRPYLIVVGNTFQQNQAFMGGNAIYIRNTLKKSEQGQICGGGYIDSSIFNQNIGLKAHNGGAISALCQYLDNPYHDDYGSTSSIKSVWLALDATSDLIEPVDSIVDGEQSLSVLSFKFYIGNSNFTENLSGNKGSAIYFRHISKIKILRSSFQFNGPVTTVSEYTYSPQTIYFTNRATSYLDPSGVCLDEFSFLSQCAQSTQMIIDWPKIQGAIHIHHCQEEFCTNENNYEVVIIQYCDFEGNDVGAALEKDFPADDNALSIYIQGGQNQLISNCKFHNHEGQQDYYAKFVSFNIAKYFPPQYYDNAQAPIIRIQINPPNIVDNPLTYKTNFTKNTFSQNTHIQVLGTQKTYQGSLISYETNYVEGSKYTPIIVMQSNIIRENIFLGNETSLIFVRQSLLNFTDNIIYGNGYLSQLWSKKTKTNDIDFDSYIFYNSQQYGTVYLIGSEFFGTGLFHNFKNNNFQFIFAQQGSAVTLKIDNQFAQFTNNTHKYLYSLKGAALQAYSYDTTRSTIRLNNNLYENIFSKYSGAITLDSDFSDSLQLIVSSCSFRSLFSQDGSAIYAEQIAIVLVNQSIFTDNQQLIYSQNRTQLIFPQFIKKQWDLQLFVDLQYFNILNNNITRNSGQIYLDSLFNTKNVTFTNILLKTTNITFSEFVDNFFENLTSQTSSAIYAKKSNIRVTTQKLWNSGFRNLRHGAQGAIKIDLGSQLVGENVIFQNCTCINEKAGAIYSSGSQITFFNITFNLNQAKDKGGCIYQTENSVLKCNQCQFTNNVASVSAAIYGSNNDQLPLALTLSNSIFTNNSGDESLIYLSNTNAKLENLTFVDNIGRLVNNGITILKSTVVASNISVNYDKQKSQLSLNVDTGFFSVQQQGNLTINKGSRFMNCKGSKASVIGVSGGSSLYIDQQSNFSMNQGISTISLQLANQVKISNSQFVGNGDYDIYIERSTVQLINTQFVSTLSNSIYANVGNLSITNVTFRDSKNQLVQGKALYCNCQNLLVDQCNFTKLQALEGGAMYLTSSTKQSIFIIKNSSFINNKAMHGGAIKMMDGGKVSFSGNQFLFNTAKVISPPNFMSKKLIQYGIGAALNLDCNNEIQGLSRNCDVNIVQNNIFNNNTASGDGGAIIFLANLYKQDNSNVFFGNKALYGADVASYPREVQVEFINNKDYLNPVQNEPSLIHLYKSGRILQNTTNTNINITQDPKNLTFPTVVSGQAFYFLVYIIDQTGQLLQSENTAFAKIETNNSQVQIIGDIVQASRGIFNFSDANIITTPGTQTNLNLTVSGLETYDNDVLFFDSPIQISISVRKCAKGEQYTNDSRCVQCDSSNYLFIAPHKPTECLPCPNEAICFGLDNIAPRAGYYRVSNESAIFYTCPNPKACIQGNLSNPLGECGPGYTGTMCANCFSGYRKSGPYECTKCPNIALNLGYLLILATLTGAVVIILVRAHIMIEEDKQVSVYQVLLKMIIHHFHFMGILMSVEYYWPSELTRFQGTYTYFSGISQEIFSFDCFLQKGTEDMDETPSVQILKLIFFAISPLLILLGSAIFWTVNAAIRRQFHELKTKIIASTLVVFFIMHPSIARIFFSYFNCVQVGDSSYLRDDISTECFVGNHLIYSMIIALPAILIWVFGVPISIAIILYKSKTQIYQLANAGKMSKIDKNKIMDLRKKYGYVFGGYKRSLFFWELIIVLIKTIFVMVTVFLKAVSSETQVLVGLLILIISMIFQVRFQPYSTQRVNMLQLYSFQITSLTMYAGMFYVSGQHYDYMKTSAIKWFFLILILVPNLAFLVIWANMMRIEVLKLAFQRGKNFFKMVTCQLIDADQFERIHLRKGAEEDDQDKDEDETSGKQAEFTPKITKGHTNRSDIYKEQTEGGPHELDSDQATKKHIGNLKLKNFASEDDNFDGVVVNESGLHSSDSYSRRSNGASPANFESDKSNGYNTKNARLNEIPDLFPGARVIRSPTNNDITNTSRRHTSNRLMDTDLDISQRNYAPPSQRKVYPEQMLTYRGENISPIDNSERNHFVFDSNRKKGRSNSKNIVNQSRDSRRNRGSDDDQIYSGTNEITQKDRKIKSSRSKDQRINTNSRQSPLRNESFSSAVHDETNNKFEDDFIEIDQIQISDDDNIIPTSNRIKPNFQFSTFDQTFKNSKKDQLGNIVGKPEGDPKNQKRRRKRKSEK